MSCRSPPNLNQKQPMSMLDSVTPAPRGWASLSEVIPSADKGCCRRWRSERVLYTVHPTANLCAEPRPRFHGYHNRHNRSLLPRSARGVQQRGSVSVTRLEEGLWQVGQSSSYRADRLFLRRSQVQCELSASPREPRIALRKWHTW